VFVGVPPLVGAQRAMARFDDPQYILGDGGAKPGLTYDGLTRRPDLIDSYEAYDNNVGRGEAAKRLASGYDPDEAWEGGFIRALDRVIASKLGGKIWPPQPDKPEK
jgi:hypothetical protein